jgi:hypothetical protein
VCRFHLGNGGAGSALAIHSVKMIYWPDPAPQRVSVRDGRRDISLRKKNRFW